MSTAPGLGGSPGAANELSGSAGGHVIQAGSGMTGPGRGNQFSGTVGANAVQARSISGGVHFHAGPQPGTVVPLPRQLPPLPSHFTGRADEVAAITGAADSGGAGSLAIVVISGAGGTGKTAIAVHALHQVAGRYPGGQLHAALGGFSPAGPAEPGAVLAGWLRALGVHPSGLPAGPGEAAALFRSLTAQNPVAILADDAASAEQARAILPGAGLVIITSRHQLADLVALDGARFISLGPLGPAAAAELAARVAGRDAPAAAFTELADCCGNLPLAIRATAALLAVRPQLGMEQVVADLTARRQGLPASGTSQEGIVTAAMHASYDRLDREAARTYRLLSLHPGPDFTAAAAAALLDADADQAGHLISVLAGASLLEEALPGRWRYHDLSRAHARQTAAATDGEDERAAAVARAIDYYLRASAAADLLILPGRRRIAEAFSLPARDQPAHASTADAVAWLDAEQANLLHAQKTAADQARHATAWQFCDTMWGWCRSRHDYPAWKQVCEQAVASAKACSDPRAEVHAATRLASCLIAMGEAAAAAPVAEEAVATAWANGDRAGEGSAREHAGICALERGDYQAAISHCNRGLDCWRRVSQHERAEAILHRLLGRAYAALGDHRQAHAHLNTALGIFTRLGEDYHAARARYILAITRLAAAPGGEHAGEAIDLLQQARPVMEAEDQPLPLSELLTALAEAHARTGNTSVAQACLEEASALHQGLRLPASHPARARARAIAGQLATPHSPQAHHAQAHDSHEPPEPGG